MSDGTEARRVRAWVTLDGHTVSAEIEVPPEVFDAQGRLVKGDAIEYVERWFTEELGFEYGVEALPGEESIP